MKNETAADAYLRVQDARMFSLADHSSEIYLKELRYRVADWLIAIDKALEEKVYEKWNDKEQVNEKDEEDEEIECARTLARIAWREYTKANGLQSGFVIKFSYYYDKNKSMLFAITRKNECIGEVIVSKEGLISHIHSLNK